MATPACPEPFVDHELSINLDSTFAFEGPEKLLEIWFWKSESVLPESAPVGGLRSIARESWAKMLDLVSCKILSMKSSRYMDAYLLSESSLFVFPHKLILKTCGTTTTLACLEELFTMAQSICAMGSKEIYRVFYSRRSFMFPEKQIHVHKDWKHEVSLLNQHFSLGKSYVVGNFDSDDHWYLYVGGEEQDHPSAGSSADQTFEILMTELDPECASKFIYSRKPGDDIGEQDDLGHELGWETMMETELDTVFQSPRVNTHLPSPSLSDVSEDEDCMDCKTDDNCLQASANFEFINDAFAFTPCGYSSNSICSNVAGGYYYTLHITPESGWSYASFETNYPFNETVDVITVLTKVLKIFKPKKFSLTLIEEISDEQHLTGKQLVGCDLILKELGYKRNEKAVYDLKNEYNLLYMNFRSG
ncbi:uncharacterized protein LODBEIA_P57140 [Lodderomyces beijingensis]|uniref:adenosylmethionine decarboxylase n=1 Tax=Lodderomyces beijingensis TaxID=1775926 RepID=A0ABP0ZJN6_9ASCO